LFQVGKQFDAILVDTSVPSLLSTTSLDTTNVSIYDIWFQMLWPGLHVARNQFQGNSICK